MRAIGLASLAALFLCACATVEEPEPDTPEIFTERDALPPQDLKSGDCGLFGWSRPEGAFIFFSSDRQAKIAGQNGEERLTPQEAFPAEDYGSVQLVLGEGETLLEGTRYPRARLSYEMEDGFTRVQPIVALVTCVP